MVTFSSTSPSFLVSLWIRSFCGLSRQDGSVLSYIDSLVRMVCVYVAGVYLGVFRRSDGVAPDLGPVDALVECLVYQPDYADILASDEVEAEGHFCGGLFVILAADYSFDGLFQDLWFGIPVRFSAVFISLGMEGGPVVCLPGLWCCPVQRGPQRGCARRR